MSNPNLFLSLFKYRPRETLSPKENFLTESFAYLLNKFPQAGRLWASRVLGRDVNEAEIESIDTQQFEDNEEERSFYDMVIKGADRTGDWVVCAEHKWQSKVSDAQLRKYWKRIKVQGKGVVLAFVGESDEQKSAASKYARSFVWSDVYASLSAVDPAPPLVREFLEFLRTQGLAGVQPLTKELLRKNDGITQSALEIFAAKLASESKFDWNFIPSEYRREIDWTSRGEGLLLNFIGGQRGTHA